MRALVRILAKNTYSEGSRALTLAANNPAGAHCARGDTHVTA